MNDRINEVPPEYQNSPDHPFTLAEFAETVTLETLSYFLLRIAKETSNKDYIQAILEDAAKTLGVDHRDLNSQLQALTSDDTPDFISKYNERHAVVMVGGKCVVLNEGIDPVTSEYSVTFSSLSDFKSYYSNDWVMVPHETIKDKKIKLKCAPVWLESEQRRQYRGIVFEPGRTVEGYYNTWRGLAVEPKAGDWSLMRDHIFKIICRGDEKIFQWLMAWMARIVQDPGGERPGTCIVLQGGQGTGKGIFAREFGKFFGPHFLHIMSAGQIAGRFTGHLANKAFIFCDEAIWNGEKMMSGVLKAIITEPTFAIEFKHMDISTVRNYVNLMVASNSDFIIPAEIDERRFCVLEVSSDRAKDIEYFGNIISQMDHGGREAMLYDLLHLDISGVDLRTIPRTDALLSQIMENMPTETKFWMDCLMKHHQLSGRTVDDGFCVEKKILYGQYQSYAKQNGEKNILSHESFGRRLKKYCPTVITTERSSTRDRPMLYKFPPLGICRKQFEKAIGMSGIFSSKVPVTAVTDAGKHHDE